MVHDVIVIGVGGMGSAALCHLAERGQRVLGIERFTPGHAFGSSHGLTRIIRLAYFEHPGYVPLLRRAFELWRSLECGGPPLLHVTGALDVGVEGGEVFEGSRRSCIEHGLAHEVLDRQALEQRFPAWRGVRGMRAVFQPDGGFLEPERCIDAHVTRARERGASLHVEEQVIEWRAGAGGVRVRTDRAEYEAGQLLLTAGPWTGGLVPGLAGRLTPERQVVGWFKTPDRDVFAPGSFPVFILDAPEGRFYGFPEHGIEGFKIGRYHHRGGAVDPDGVDRECHSEDEEALREAVRRYFPQADGPLLKSSVCMFTNTPDEHFIVDRHPEHSGVWIISACSGHGFKFSSVIGEIAADLVTRGATPHDISMFRLSRFS